MEIITNPLLKLMYCTLLHTLINPMTKYIISGLKCRHKTFSSKLVGYSGTNPLTALIEYFDCVNSDLFDFIGLAPRKELVGQMPYQCLPLAYATKHFNKLYNYFLQLLYACKLHYQYVYLIKHHTSNSQV